MAISGWGIFLIAFLLVVALAAVGYYLYAHYRANKLGLPPPNLNPFARKSGRTDPAAYRAPAPAPGGIQGWISDKWARLQNNSRTAGGAYESTGYNASGERNSRRGLGPLDPDEAWDARVDHEMGALYEEEGGREFGGSNTLHDIDAGPYGGGGYGNSGAPQAHLGPGRVDARYEEEVRAGRGGPVASRAVATTNDARGGRSADPFGDQAERSDMSLRAVSPRPDAGHLGAQRPPGHKRGASSLTVGGSNEGSPTERRSMFHENM